MTSRQEDIRFLRGAGVTLALCLALGAGAVALAYVYWQGALRDHNIAKNVQQETKLGHDLNLLTCEWAPLWVVDFPMFEEVDDGKWTSVHHPFTMPHGSVEELKANPGAATSVAYDMVLNGTEIGGGSLRIYNLDMQKAVFEALGIGEEEAQEKFVSKLRHVKRLLVDKVSKLKCLVHKAKKINIL